MSSKHTPGPWVPVESCEGAPLPAGMVVAIQTEAEPFAATGRICRMIAQGESGRYSPSISHANALLIAAAPELLEALTDIAQGNVPPGFCKNIEKESPDHFRQRLLLWVQERARAAIAKATGDTP